MSISVEIRDLCDASKCCGRANRECSVSLAEQNVMAICDQIEVSIAVEISGCERDA
jgi:hypothetical protein